MRSQTVLSRGRSLKIAMQSSLWRHFRNIPMPLPSSVVDKICRSFSNFYSPIKGKFPGGKRQKRLGSLYDAKKDDEMMMLSPGQESNPWPSVRPAGRSNHWDTGRSSNQPSLRSWSPFRMGFFSTQVYQLCRTRFISLNVVFTREPIYSYFSWW